MKSKSHREALRKAAAKMKRSSMPRSPRAEDHQLFAEQLMRLACSNLELGVDVVLTWLARADKVDKAVYVRDAKRREHLKTLPLSDMVQLAVSARAAYFADPATWVVSVERWLEGVYEEGVEGIRHMKARGLHVPGALPDAIAMIKKAHAEIAAMLQAMPAMPACDATAPLDVEEQSRKLSET